MAKANDKINIKGEINFAKKYEGAIEAVYADGKEYIVIFAKGYEFLGIYKKRRARRKTEVMWYSRLGTQSKDGTMNTLEHLANECKKENLKLETTDIEKVQDYFNKIK